MYSNEKASAYWSDRVNSVDNKRAVLYYSETDVINDVYDQWTTNIVLGTENIDKMKILDVACGVGRILVRLAEKGIEVYGVDISKQMVKISNNQLSKLFIDTKSAATCACSDDLPFDELNFDLIYCLGLFEHLPEDKQLKTILEIHRVLKSKGQFIIETNNSNSIFLKKNNDNEFRKGKQFENGYYCGLVNYEKLIKTLETVGFDIVKKYYNPYFGILKHTYDRTIADSEESKKIFQAALLADLKGNCTKEEEIFSEQIILRCTKK